ncbi:hypothetical protein ASZ90_010555 [hydrocarbon metagenome]|uniref:Uncharacterized protein n=1 Tax=hydrocarbon metagenome TaxID=938273 RepID=A0A0W8FFM8_9ZZZZ
MQEQARLLSLSIAPHAGSHHDPALPREWQWKWVLLQRIGIP